MSRRSSYTQEMGDAICQRMCDGESLRQICKDESMPYMSVVMRWARDIPEFQEHYARAREDLQAHWAEQILEIADSPLMGIKTETKGEEVKTITGDMIEHRRLQIDTRKWLLSKLAPKKYGEKVDLTHANPDGTNMTGPIINIGFVNGGPGEPDSSAEGS